jgi:xanthine dehydrogenase accessory factor
MDHPQAWIEKLSELHAQGRPCAVVVVTGVRGSGPREAGARMIVALGDSANRGRSGAPLNRKRIGANGGRAENVAARIAPLRANTSRPELVFGTVGGGNLELQAIEHCAELLKLGTAVSESVAYPLSEKVGQCCGGEVTLFFETFPWTRRRIAVFGAGHVAQAIGGLAGYLSADLVLIDSREESEIRPAPPLERRYELVCVDNPEQELDELPGDTLVLVMTHNHALDLEIVARAIKLEFPYLGLIGSERKWQRFRRRLEQRGFSPDEISRVRCPIGVSKHSKEPTAIAISVAAELLEVMQSALAIHPQRRASS